MKLLKLIPAAAIALTAFTTFEAKAFKICLYNNAGFSTKLMVGTRNDSVSKTSNYFTAGLTECIKMGDIPISGGKYKVQYKTYSFGFAPCNYNSGNYSKYTSSDSGKTKTYTVSGTTSYSSCEL